MKKKNYRIHKWNNQYARDHISEVLLELIVVFCIGLCIYVAKTASGDNAMISDVCDVYRGWYTYEDGVRVEVKDHKRYKTDEEGRFIIYNTLPRYITSETKVEATGMYNRVTCLIDGIKRAECDDAEYRLWQKDPIESFLMVDLVQSDAQKEIQLIYETEVERFKGYYFDTHIGTRTQINNYYTAKETPEFCTAIFALCAGLICFLLAFLYTVRDVKVSTVSLFYLGMAIIMFGFCALYNSHSTKNLLGNTYVWYYLYNVSIFLFPVPAMLYLDKQQKEHQHEIYQHGVYLAEVVFIVCFALQIFGVKDLTGMGKVRSIAVAVELLVVIWANVREFRHGDRKVFWQGIVTVSILAVTFIVHAILRYALDLQCIYTPVNIGIVVAFAVAVFTTISQLSRASQEAIAASNAKSTFLANMSHEIRTPINAILGLNEMILRDSGEEDTKQFASDIKIAGNTLLHLISNVLDFSKIESGKMELVESSYLTTSLLIELISIMKPQFQKKGLIFKLSIDESIPCVLQGDEGKLREILLNLLNNAYKYTNEGEIELQLRRNPENSNNKQCEIFVRIKDTGIGIQTEDLSTLFDTFSRVDTKRNRDVEGSGLGLAICTKLLNLMGSSIQVNSTYGKGSEFYFTLIQKVTDESPIGPYQEWGQSLRDSKEERKEYRIPDAEILVVDDVSVNLTVMKGLLKRTEAHVELAGSGRDCLALAEQKKYDIIFMDHLMPEMDGIETLHKLKAMKESPNRETPVVVLTANAVSGYREVYLKSGFSDYLTKPVVVDDLENILKKYIGD